MSANDTTAIPELDTETVRLADLRPHPRNYKTHPEDQLAHLEASIREFGFIRNVVIARENTILCGHGAVIAAERAGLVEIPARRLDLDPNEPAALKVLALENELGRFAHSDDRALTELLRTLRDESPTGLLGTGYDDRILANLLMVTRPAHEIATIDEAAQWVGMPEFNPHADEARVVVHCETEEACEQVIERLGLIVTKHVGNVHSGWWPPRGLDDSVSVMFDG